MPENRKGRDAFKFSIAGALFGSAFPFLATTIEILNNNLPLSFESLVRIQRANPLLWIIDSAIPILAAAGYLIGNRQQQLKLQTVVLEDGIRERSQEIHERQLFYEALVETSPIAIVTLDPNHKILSANPAFEAVFGFRSQDIFGKNLDALISDPQTESEAYEITRDVLSGKTIRQITKRRRSDGSLVDVEILGKPILIAGELRGVLGLYRDITAEKNAREDLEASESRFRSLFQNSPIALRLEDLSDMQKRVRIIQHTFGISLPEYFESQPQKVSKLLALAKVRMANDAALSLFESPTAGDLQKNIGYILSPESLSNAIEIVAALAEGKTSIEKELIYKIMDGKKKIIVTRLTILPGHESDWSRVLFSSVDITDRKLAEERMAYISLHDMMTGLYNRVFFDEELARLEKSRIRPVTIMVCDMDNLKNINDQYGHRAGDIALQNIANILKSCFRDEDVLARIGGDEFSVILPHVSSEAMPPVINRIHLEIKGHNQKSINKDRLALSIGFSTAEKNGSLLQAFKDADSAMYQQKASKREKV